MPRTSIHSSSKWFNPALMDGVLDDMSDNNPQLIAFRSDFSIRPGDGLSDLSYSLRTGSKHQKVDGSNASLLVTGSLKRCYDILSANAHIVELNSTIGIRDYWRDSVKLETIRSNGSFHSEVIHSGDIAEIMEKVLRWIGIIEWESSRI